MTNLAAQPPLLGPQEEASTYHDPARTGFFSLLVAEPGIQKKRQSCHRLVDMPCVLAAVDPTLDTWLSQAEFIRPNRRVVNLLRIGLLFADLDTYKMPWARSRSPESLAAAVLFFCVEEGIPTPSILVYSGRGIQAKWLLEGTIPRQALMRWNACQHHLVDRLAPMGADPGAKDASRVLRLIETTNSKSQEKCRVVHVEAGLDGGPVRYNFECLAAGLLPMERQVIERQRKERTARCQLQLIKGSRTSPLRGLANRRLAWDRLEDLRTLAVLRGGVKEGERMRHLFWRLNFLLLSGACRSSTMYYEAAVLAKEIDSSWNHCSRELMTLYAKAKAFESGAHVIFNGKKYPALYTPRNDTLINMLEISSDEQRQLKTIISKDMALERDKKRDEGRRRASGAQERAVYLKNVEKNVEKQRAQAQALRQKGLTVRDIAERMGVSARAIARYLAQKHR